MKVQSSDPIGPSFRKTRVLALNALSLRFLHFNGSSFLAMSVVIVGALLLSYSPSASAHPEAPSPQPIQLTIPQLVEQSDRIVLGRIGRVTRSVHWKYVDGRKIQVPIQITKFEHVERSFGNVKPGESIVIREYEPLATRVQEGEVVLWFLKKTNASGFDSPLGDKAGDFRITTDASGQRTAFSKAFNRGLWSKEISLWKSFPVEFTEALQRELKRQWPTKAAQLISDLDRKCTPTPVELELLLAAASLK